MGTRPLPPLDASGAFLRPLPLEFGRFRYRSGFVARRSAEKAEAFRRLEALVRETALGRERQTGVGGPLRADGPGPGPAASQPIRDTVRR